MNNTYYYVLDTLIKHLTIGFASFTIIVNLSRLFKLPFVFIAYGVLVLCICISYSFVRSISNKSLFYAINIRMPFVLLLFFALSTGVITGSILAPEEDDAVYLSPVIRSINNPEMPISTDIDWIVPWDTGEKLRSTFTQTSSVYEYFWGVVSYLTGIEYLYLYQLIGSLFWGAAFFTIYYYLLSRFINEQSALFGSFCLVTACLLFFREGGIGIGLYLTKIWIGKSILLMVILPLIAAFAFDYLKRPSKLNWFYVFVACIAASGFSISSLFLVPSLMLVLTLGSLFTIIQRQSYKEVIYTCALPATAIYPFIVGAINYTLYKTKLSVNTSIKLGYSGKQIFGLAYNGLFGEYLSVSSLIILSSVIYLFFLRRKEYPLIIAWFTFSVLLFANPFSADFVATHLTSYLVYGRIFFVVPWFVILGLVLGDLFQIITKHIHYSVIYICITTVSIIFVFGIIYTFGWDRAQRGLDVSKSNYLGKPIIGVLSPKIDVNLIKDIHDISNVLPHGNTLSTMEYNLAIPMITDKYPQYYTWPPSNVSFFGDSSGHQEEGELRYGVAQFLMGDENHRNEFNKLLKSPVKNMIIGRRWIAGISNFEKSATVNGFILIDSNPRYILFSRP